MACADIFHVDGTKATNGDGQFWSTAFNNLQSAIAAAATNVDPEDEIWVRGSASGITYKPGTSRGSTFQLQNRVKIYGGFAGTETDLFQRDPFANVTILSGDIGDANDPDDNCYHVVKATGKLEFPLTVLDGFTITGRSAADPRGIEMRASAERASRPYDDP